MAGHDVHPEVGASDVVLGEVTQEELDAEAEAADIDMQLEFEELEARTALSSSPADVPGSRLEPRSQAEAAPRQIIATQVLSRELLATSAGNDDQNRSPSLSELVGTASQDANKPHEKRHKSR